MTAKDFYEIFGQPFDFDPGGMPLRLRHEL